MKCSHTYNPGEMWFIDGSDSTQYSMWGNKRYCINTVDAATCYRVCYYTTTNNAGEFCDFINYLVKLTRFRTGNDVKKLYSDYFSTYMDNRRVAQCRTQDGRAIELVVTPPYLKARNTYAENSIYSNRKAARARLFNLLGKNLRGMPIKDTTKFWLMAWEHGVQTHNFSAYEPLMELYVRVDFVEDALQLDLLEVIISLVVGDGVPLPTLLELLADLRDEERDVRLLRKLGLGLLVCQLAGSVVLNLHRPRPRLSSRSFTNVGACRFAGMQDSSG